MPPSAFVQGARVVQLQRLQLHNTVLPVAHPNSRLRPSSDCCFPLISRFYCFSSLFTLCFEHQVEVQIRSNLFNCVRDSRSGIDSDRVVLDAVHLAAERI